MKLLTTSLIAALTLPAAADILTLKDGTKLDATIVSKTLEEYQLEVNVTKSIKEPRTIKRSDVVNIERVNEADSIFEEQIAGLTPAPPFLELEGYDSRIKTLKSFLKENKITEAGTKAVPMLEELEAERKIIAAGGIKTSLEPDGMIKAEDRAKDAIGIAASIEATKFQNLVKARSYLAALRQYDVLEKSYAGTTPHREAIPLMSRLVNSYADLLARELTSAEQREERRMTTLNQLGESDRQRAMEAEEQRLARVKAIAAKEDEEDQRWRTVDPQSVESLEDTITALEQESKRLDEVQGEVAKMDDLAELYRKGWVLAGEKKKEELETVLDSMDAAGATEDEINMLVDRFDPTINNPPAEEEGGDAAMKDEGGDGEMMDDKGAEEESDTSE